MLSAKITLKSTNYEKTFRNLFPALSTKIEQVESDHLLIRLLKSLEATVSRLRFL